MSFMNNELVTSNGTKNEVYDIFKNDEFLYLKNTCFHMKPDKNVTVITFELTL